MKCTVSKLQIVIAILFVIVGAFTGHVYGQTATPSPTPSEEIQRLTEEKERAELRKAIAEARKAELEARFPKPTTSPLAGETKINEGVAIESEMVSFLSMAYAANRIIDQVRLFPVNNLAIYNQADVNLLLNYNVTTSQLDVMKQSYCSVLSGNYVPDACPTPTPSATASPSPCPSPQVQPRSLLRSMPEEPLSIAASFLGAFVDLTALLRTNVDIQGHTFTIDEAALVSEVFRAARATDGLRNSQNNGKPNMYYPAAFPPNIDANTKSELLLKLEVLHILKADVDELIGGLEDVDAKIKKAGDKADELDAALKDVNNKLEVANQEMAHLSEDLKHVLSKIKHDEILMRIHELTDSIKNLQTERDKIENTDIPKNKAKLKDLLNQRDQLLQDLAPKVRPHVKQDGTLDLDPVIAKLKAVNDQFEKFVDSLVKTDAASGMNSLTAYIKAENLKNVLNDDSSYWLQLDVVKAGGNNRIKTNLIWDIFTGGNRVSHSGGAIVEYNLYDRNGRSLASDTITEYTGYIKASKVKHLPNPVTVAEGIKK